MNLRRMHQGPPGFFFKLWLLTEHGLAIWLYPIATAEPLACHFFFYLIYIFICREQEGQTFFC